jgi:alanine dehydrogenase
LLVLINEQGDIISYRADIPWCASLLIIGREEVDSVVDPQGLVEDIRNVYLSQYIAFERVSSIISGSWFGIMRGFHEELGFLVKIVGIFPQAYPRVKGVVVVIDHVTGNLKALIDGYSLTGWRTAGASALAQIILGGYSIETLGIIGAGTQALYHLRVFTKLFRIGRILISTRSPEKARDLAREFGAEQVSARDLNATATTVIAATNSPEPVVIGDLLSPGSIVISVGAPKPVRELDERTIQRAGCALVDTRQGVLEESDDVKGIEVVEIGEALRGKRCVFRDIKLYKSVGTSILDIAGAIHILRRMGVK